MFPEPLPQEYRRDHGRHQQTDDHQNPAEDEVRIAKIICFGAGHLTLRRDLDQIKADLESPKHLKQFQETKAAEDLPALGRHYCIECAKYYESESTLVAHRRGKPHKRRYVFRAADSIFRYPAADILSQS